MTGTERPRAWTRSLLLALGLLVLLPSCGGGGGRSRPEEPDPPFQPPDGVDTRLNSDPAGAQLSVFPEICGADQRVYVTWYDRRDGDTDVYFNRSLDAGVTWGATDVRLDTDAPGTAGSNVPRICCDGDRVVVVWSDQRSTLSEIRCNRSIDAGADWLDADVRIDRATPGDGSSGNPDVCCVGDAVYAVWQDSRDGLSDVYFSRSTDGGLTWLLTDVRLNTDTAGEAQAEFPRIACAGSSLYVVWQDDRDGEPDIRFNRSVDGGVNWLASDARLDTDDAGVGPSYEPRLACDGTRVGVVWSDGRHGLRDIRYNGSADGGASWLSADVRLDTDAPGAGQSLVPTLCVQGGDVSVVWEDARAGMSDVYFSHSSDGGANWSFADVQVNTDPPGTANAFLPQIACETSRLHVVWYDDREGAFDVLLSTSSDGGSTWAEEETRLDSDPAGAAHSIAPKLCVVSGKAHVVWYDQRDGPGDIYANAATAP